MSQFARLATMKLEKILGKKFVRGKPYYKIKWDGVGKDQSTWESPPSIAKYRSVIDRYEVKNWGAPLDQKFFDPDIYINKGFAHRSKSISDKKNAKETKRKEKKKLEQPSDDEEDPESHTEEEETKAHQKKTRRSIEAFKKSEVPVPQPKQQKLESEGKVSKQAREVMIIDSDSDKEREPNEMPRNVPVEQKVQVQLEGKPSTIQHQTPANIQKMVIPIPSKSAAEVVSRPIEPPPETERPEKDNNHSVEIGITVEVVNKDVPQIEETPQKQAKESGKIQAILANIPARISDIEVHEFVSIPDEAADIQINHQGTQVQMDEQTFASKQQIQLRSLNMSPEVPNPPQIPQQAPIAQKLPQLTINSPLSLGVEPTPPVNKVWSIYHLQKLSVGHHLYLVEYQDRRMIKMTTAQLMGLHPEELVTYLQKKLKSKKDSRRY